MQWRMGHKLQCVSSEQEVAIHTASCAGHFPEEMCELSGDQFEGNLVGGNVLCL